MYGCQAVVISCDPKRQYVADPAALEPPPGKLPAPTVLKMAAGDEGPEGEGYAWYACTTQGGRETRQLDAIGLAVACEALGAVRRTPISTPTPWQQRPTRIRLLFCAGGDSSQLH